MSERRFEVALTQGAEDDLEAIHGYLAEHHSIDAAESLLDAFLEKISTLERHPERGSVPRNSMPWEFGSSGRFCSARIV